MSLPGGLWFCGFGLFRASGCTYEGPAPQVLFPQETELQGWRRFFYCCAPNSCGTPVGLLRHTGGKKTTPNPLISGAAGFQHPTLGSPARPSHLFPGWTTKAGIDSSSTHSTGNKSSSSLHRSTPLWPKKQAGIDNSLHANLPKALHC